RHIRDRHIAADDGFGPGMLPEFRVLERVSKGWGVRFNLEEDVHPLTPRGRRIAKTGELTLRPPFIHALVDVFQAWVKFRPRHCRPPGIVIPPALEKLTTSHK